MRKPVHHAHHGATRYRSKSCAYGNIAHRLCTQRGRHRCVAPALVKLYVTCMWCLTCEGHTGELKLLDGQAHGNSTRRRAKGASIIFQLFLRSTLRTHTNTTPSYALSTGSASVGEAIAAIAIRRFSDASAATRLRRLYKSSACNVRTRSSHSCRSCDCEWEPCEPT